MKHLRFCLIFIAISLFAGVVSAQGAPEHIQDALADLNQRLGTTYTLNDIFWSWSQESYPDGSMGCPQGIASYPAEPTVGYEFVFTVGETEYEYRVSADRQTVFLCEERSLADQTEEPDSGMGVIGGDQETAYSNTLCPAPPAGLSYMHTRLVVDIEGRVEPGLPVRARAEPTTSAAILGELPGETPFRVIEGPTCDAEGYVWWRLDANGFIGWVAEGRDGDYFLEPKPGDALDNTYPTINVEAASFVTEVSRLQGNLGSRVTFTPDSMRLVATGAGGSEGIWIYDVNDLAAGPRIINSGNLITEIAFGTASNLAVLGSGNGSVRLWNIAPDANIVERIFLQAHDRTVTGVAFSSNEKTMASTGGKAFTRVDDPGNQYAILLWDIDSVSQLAVLRGHTDEVTALHFTPDGTGLLSGGLDGAIRVWTVNTGTLALETDLGEPVLDAAYSPDGSLIAAALVNGQVSLIAGTQRFVFPAHSGPVNTLAFSPDGSVLVTGGDDGLVHLWSVAGLMDANIADVPLMTLTGHTDSIHDVVFSPNGLLLGTLSRDNTLRLWAVMRSYG